MTKKRIHHRIFDGEHYTLKIVICEYFFVIKHSLENKNDLKRIN